MLRFRCLGSGSAGNALAVEAQGRGWTPRVRVDNGFRWSAFSRRLERAGLSVDDIDAIVVTHEHGDRSDGVAGVLRRASDAPAAGVR